MENLRRLLLGTVQLPLKVESALKELATNCRWIKYTIIRPSHTMHENLIVSMATYEKRFAVLHVAIRSIIVGAVKPEKIIVWMKESDLARMPSRLKKLEKYSVEFRCVEQDMKSYNKIAFTEKLNESNILVTADDDLIYPKNWLAKLIEAFEKEDKDILIGHRGVRIEIDSRGKPAKYVTWKEAPKGLKSHLVVVTSGAGILFPKNTIKAEYFNFEIINAICPTADDLWIYAIFRANGFTFRSLSTNSNKIVVVNKSQSESLWSENVLNGKNDFQFNNIMTRFPQILESLK